jgi:alanine racemase
VDNHFYRDTWAEINLDAIKANIKAFQNHLPNETGIIAVVKANGYGHGAVQAAEAAVEAGAARLAVALLDEALLLRRVGFKVPIHVLGWVHPKDVQIAAKHHIELTVFQAEWLIEAKKSLSIPVKLHVKIDTGMGRLGTTTFTELKEIANEINQSKWMTFEGIFTHFATADEPNSSLFYKQHERFQQVLTLLEELESTPNIIHTSNSAAAIQLPKKGYHFIRLGISMYGLQPSPELVPPFPLHEAFSLHSRLTHVKQVKKGDTISYGATYEASQTEWIGTIPIGYADGWIRKIGTHGKVIVNGKRAPIIGRICMDQMMIRLPEKMDIGTKVTLIGSQQNEHISIDDLAKQLDTINYEIPCMISNRVPRVFYKNSKKIGCVNGFQNL